MKAWLIAGVGALLLVGPVAAQTTAGNFSCVCSPQQTPSTPAEALRNAELEEATAERARAEVALQVARLRLELAQAEAALERLTQASRLRQKQAGAMRKDRLTGTSRAAKGPGIEGKLDALLKALESNEARLRRMEAVMPLSAMYAPPPPPTSAPPMYSAPPPSAPR